MSQTSLPAHWHIAKFEEVAQYALGRTPPRDEPSYWQAGRYPWVSIADMVEFGTVAQTKEKVSRNALEQIFKNKLVPSGTLLMSFKLTIGRTSILETDACHNEAIISIYPETHIDRDFLMYYLPTIDYEDRQDRVVKGNILNRSKINLLPIPVPPLVEQRAIVHTLKVVHAAVQTRKA
jgi:type I restriction enzyme S subunit